MPVINKREPLTAAEIKAYRASLPPDERDPSARSVGGRVYVVTTKKSWIPLVGG